MWLSVTLTPPPSKGFIFLRKIIGFSLTEFIEEKLPKGCLEHTFA